MANTPVVRFAFRQKLFQYDGREQDLFIVTIGTSKKSITTLLTKVAMRKTFRE